MKQLAVVVLVSACWSSSQPAPQAAAPAAPPPAPAPAPAPASTAAVDSDGAYGGATYGGATYGSATASTAATQGILGSVAVTQGGAFASLTGTGDLSAAFGGGTSMPSARLGDAAVAGKLDKAIIRRYVRRNLQKLQYCYEKQLLAEPTLAGTVKAEFTIGVDGKVTRASATGVHPDVAACVATTIKAIEFPTPKGGDVRVTYPFVFSNGDDSAGQAAIYGVGGIGTADAFGPGSFGTVLGALAVDGGLDAATVASTVQRDLAQLRDCYDRTQANVPSLQGRVTMTFTIGATGTVRSARAVGLDARIERCIEGVLRAMTFPAPKGGTARVSYPISFSPSSYGLGLRGTGAGGGGTGYGTIGLGNYGTIGHGSGTGSGYGIGRGGMRGRAAAPTAKLGEATTTGPLDKAIIRRYVMRTIQKVRYCYEKQLVKTPKLAGKVTAKFTIGADGTVLRSTASGLHPDVDTCIARALGGIEFAKPAGGGVVEVTYPFVFAPAPDDATSAP